MDRNSILDNLVFGDAEYDKERRERQRRRRLARMEEKIERERRARRIERRKRITVAVICCLSIILALGALVYVVNHADEFKNIKGAEAAGLNDKTTADAETEAKSWIAEPGTSEHHTGLAVDINSEATPGTANPSEVSEPLYQWLEDNSYRYGFILRYPPGKEDITGVNYEPWHYRYVGVENAEQIHEDGLTLEEYLEK